MFSNPILIHKFFIIVYLLLSSNLACCKCILPLFTYPQLRFPALYLLPLITTALYPPLAPQHRKADTFTIETVFPAIPQLAQTLYTVHKPLYEFRGTYDQCRSLSTPTYASTLTGINSHFTRRASVLVSVLTPECQEFMVLSVVS